MAAAGIDVWRIQLHGRWGSSAVLRYVRSAPLNSTLALEASLGYELSEVRDSIIQARANLTKLHLNQLPGESASPEAVQDAVDVALGEVLSKQAGPLGKPGVTELCGDDACKGWNRPPEVGEIMVISRGRNVQPRAHALRKPTIHQGEMAISEFMSNATDNLTWCGWRFKEASATFELFSGDLAVPLCKRCFGTLPGEQDVIGTSSSEDSEAAFGSMLKDAMACHPDLDD